MSDPLILAVYVPTFLLSLPLLPLMWPVLRGLIRLRTPAFLAAVSAYFLAVGCILSVLLFGVTRLHDLWPLVPDYVAVSTSPAAIITLYACWCAALICSLSSAVGILLDWSHRKALTLAGSLSVAVVAVYGIAVLTL